MPYKHRYDPYPDTQYDPMPEQLPLKERSRVWTSSIFMACGYISVGLLIGWLLWS